jgi:hypothetical protein
MTTHWTLPTIVSQYAESGAEHAHIPWNELDNFSSLKSLDGKSIQTTQPLLHIARSPKLDIRMKTYYIQATGFNFQNLPTAISGVEARLTSNRQGRIVDETVQLCLDSVLVGNNQATLPILPIKVYGGSINLWNTSELSLTDVQNTTFGIVIRFQSHHDWPHRDPAFIDSVELRIH